ncbi:Regulator of G-protein signaling 22 [Chelonia mydas]|uniref:Regulator of G-protein signaling 22 n=1 Tax=Chelonia mydas TaxID=8469 RepID=M7AXI6_CHEMY|nr:Regulator of G-protein signaling 22 [Chelonia mydas]
MGRTGLSSCCPGIPAGLSLLSGPGVLEELLTYDDLFLEYFNAFLALPAFPLRLRYDRLRGQLQELDGFLSESPSQTGMKPSSLHYGATDAERERILGWLRRERLPPFQRTALYLEYKLAKLLIRPLDEGYPVSRHEIRGYSRCFSSVPDQLPWGSPVEFPAAVSLGQSPFAEGLSRLHLRSLLPDSGTGVANEGSVDGWTNAGGSERSLAGLTRAASSSSPTAGHIKYHLGSRRQGEPASGTRKVLQFDLDESSTSEGGEESWLLPGFGRSTLQQLKEDVLGTRAGMDGFKEFLHGTLGIHLLHFWMDCEDVMERTKCLEASAAQGEAQLLCVSLCRFEDSQKVHNFQLWQALEKHQAAWEWQADRLQPHRSAWQIFHKYLVHGAPYDVGLSSALPHYIQQLQEMLSSSNQPLEPLALEPVAQHVLVVLCEAWLHYLRHEIATFLEYCVPASYLEVQDVRSKDSRIKQRRDRARKRKENTGFHAQKGREQQRRRRKKAAAKPQGSGHTGLASGEGSVTPQRALELLNNKVVFKTYRKAAQEMQDAGLQRVLGLLEKLERCRAAPEGRKRLSCVLKLLDLFEGAGPLSPHLPRELRKRLRTEVGQGAVSDSSVEEIQAALYAHIAPTFESFWAEVSKGLDRHGVQPSRIQDEGWPKLQPLLHLLAAKVALKRLRTRKAAGGLAATAQPSQEDKASFCQFLRAAAEGWPTLERLHFLHHLQVHGPPVLEHGLHFQLEVQKFKNAHHAMPDRALLRKKVQVIRNCFLVSQLEPQLQVVVDAEKLGRAVRAAEQALQQDVPAPPPSLFDELRDSIFSTLLPYWAGFRKAWLKRSLESIQRAPVLRAQQLLQQRRALFERSQGPPQTFQLPPLQQHANVKGSKQQGGFTYTFSISRGIALKASSREDTGNRTSVFGNGKRSARVQLPPLPEVPVLL